MSTAFSFFLRCFSVSWPPDFFSRPSGWRAGVIWWLDILFLANVYWFSYLVFRTGRLLRSRLSATRPAAGAAARRRGAPVNRPARA